ncbi:MAG: hypothetical protein ACYS8Y_01165 [Planctomycetota bacterium]|jgi:chromosome condensin MukBEF ATPase and DNA-binding subunit MukB
MVEVKFERIIKMKRLFREATILIIGIAIVTMIGGCEEEKDASSLETNIKRSRLVAIENVQLKKELEQRDKEIEKQKELVEKCQQEKKVLKKQLDGDIQEQLDGMLTDVMDKNAELHEENEKLKVEIEQLKEELQKLRKRPPIPNQPQPL